MGGSETISQMADDDSFRRDTFLSQQGDLFQGQFAKMSGVRPNWDAGQLVGSRRRTKDTLLRRGNVVALGSNFSNDTSPNIRAISSNREVPDNARCEVVRTQLAHV